MPSSCHSRCGSSRASASGVGIAESTAWMRPRSSAAVSGGGSASTMADMILHSNKRKALLPLQFRLGIRLTAIPEWPVTR
jgi:hypothetical protein